MEWTFCYDPPEDLGIAGDEIKLGRTAESFEMIANQLEYYSL